MSAQIEKLIAAGDWDAARAEINRDLEDEPDNHWLITRLALTYYEQYAYERALGLSELAMELAPHCPLVLWDYAGALEMLKRPNEALAVFTRLIDRGINSIAFDECGEGLAWARGLVADCHYRSAHCHLRLDNSTDAIRQFEMHLALRGPGCRSIYPIADVRNELRAARENAA
jgi:tetratricopeptide (TPR) repeat protein